jgi:hypothetical protein
MLTINTSQTFYQNLIKNFSKTIIKTDILFLLHHIRLNQEK